MGKEVTTDTVIGEDVTEEFVDLQRSRERNLLGRELTNIRGQIEQVQGRMKYLEERTALSQITLTIHPVPSPKPSQPTRDPTRIVAQAWNASLLVLQTLATAVLSILAFSWWLAPALLAGLMW